MAETINHTKKILVCPLDWGLGHASRDVAIIQRLVDRHHKVILACDGGAYELLRSEFPELEMIRFRSHVRIRYSRFLPAWLKITLLSPLLLCEIIAEHFILKRIVDRVHPDVIISDNRYGLWNRGIKSILISHQLSIRLPRFARFLEYPAYLVLRAFTGKFDRCWIPDFPGEMNLSGDLSHRYRIPGNTVFIGAFSRFVRDAGKLSANGVSADQIPETYAPDLTVHPGLPPARSIDLVVLLSGPEPQRSSLQKIILKQVLAIKGSCVVLLGQPGKSRRVDLSSILSTYSHLTAADLRHLLLSARYVICRAGYTGIMDLALMRKKALIIPTPGQTEQEYLADYLSEKGLFLACSQNELDIESALEKLAGFNPTFSFPVEDLFEPELNGI